MRLPRTRCSPASNLVQPQEVHQVRGVGARYEEGAGGGQGDQTQASYDRDG